MEDCLGKKAKINKLPAQDGDMQATLANTDALSKAIGFTPTTTIAEGLGHFVRWYKEQYPESEDLQSQHTYVA